MRKVPFLRNEITEELRPDLLPLTAASHQVVEQLKENLVDHEDEDGADPHDKVASLNFGLIERLREGL